MTDLDKLAQWQATMDMAIYKFEQRTGLKLAGLAPPEIAQKVKEWTKANKMRNERPFHLQRYEATDRPERLNS
jgi:hypothetical protein